MKTLRAVINGFILKSLQKNAENIFEKLDDNLAPKTFIIGLIYEDLPNYPLGILQRDLKTEVVVNPQVCGYSPDLFINIRILAKEFEEKDDDKNKIHDDPYFQERYDKSLKKRSLQNAVETIINEYSNNDELISFCSYPVLLKNYLVCTILQLKKNTYFSYYRLKKEKLQVEKSGLNNIFATTSLLEGVIRNYLQKCSETLSKIDDYSGPCSESEIDELIRAAGQNLMYTPSTITGIDDFRSNFAGLDLFYVCNTISSLKYEGSESVGKMVIAKRHHPAIKEIISLAKPISINDFRAIRKMLEISTTKLFLICDYGHVYGLGHCKSKNYEQAEDLFFINFTKHYTWELLHADQVLMNVSYGQPNLPKLQINEKTFKSSIKKLFPKIRVKNITTLWTLALEAAKQKHGTMVVISAKAELEATRLENQSLKIEPVKITHGLMQLITTIDGAVLIDPFTTKCHAIGVILDGLASGKGDSSRGARYNSAIRYVETSKYACIAIVVSEDGAIDLVD